MLLLPDEMTSSLTLPCEQRRSSVKAARYARVLLVFLGLLLPRQAQAESAFGESTVDAPALAHVTDPNTFSDGVYGRFDGALSLSPHAGAELDFEDERARLLVGVAARYYAFFGLYVAYRESFDDDATTRHLLSGGVLVEPLFLLRFRKNAERGPAFWDLTLDSLSASGGYFVAAPREQSFGEESGFEAGLGMGVPLLARAPGPWLRLRGNVRFLDELAPALWLTLGWQGFFDVTTSDH